MEAALLAVLRDGVSQDVARVKHAEGMMKQLSEQAGFHSALTGIAVQRAVDSNVRWLALLVLKNGVERNWRRFQGGSMSTEEKRFIRDALLTMIEEPNDALFRQAAVTVGHIFRADLLAEWPDLIDRLVSSATSSSAPELSRRRALALLVRALKSLVSSPRGRTALQPLCASIFEPLHTQWVAAVTAFMSDRARTSPHISYALLCLRSLRQLFLYGFSEGAASATMTRFPQLCVELALVLVGLSAPAMAGDTDAAAQTLGMIGKVMLEYQERRPYAFVLDDAFGGLLEFALELTAAQAPVGSRAAWLEPFLIQMLTLCKVTVKSAAYMAPVDAEPAATARTRLAAFWSDERVAAVAKLLIDQYLPLGPNDLTMWEEDAEEFVSADDSEAWRVLLRPCAELLFASLSSRFRHVVAPMVTAMLAAVLEVPVSALGDADLFRRDAVYAAVQIGAYDLYDYVDFDALLSGPLALEAALEHRWSKVLRRRVAQLIQRWVPVKLSPAMRPATHALLLQLLDGAQDISVRTSAARALKVCVDDFDFDESHFAPFLRAVLLSLAQLVIDAQSYEIESLALDGMSVVIERMADHVTPLLGDIERVVPRIWEHASRGGNGILKIGLVVFLTKLVEALKAHSALLMPFVAPCVQHALMAADDDADALMEDALLLWLAAVRNAPALSQELVSLVPMLFAMLQRADGSYDTALDILTSYLLYRDEEFFAAYGAAIAALLEEMVRVDMNASALARVMNVYAIALQTFSAATQPLLTGGLRAAAALVFEDLDERGISQPALMAMLARFVAVHGAPALASLLGPVGLFHLIIEKFIEDWTMVAQSLQQKVICYCIASLIAHFNELPALHTDNRADRLLTVAARYVERLSGSETVVEEGFSEADFGDEVIEYDVADSAEANRRRALRYADPTATQRVGAFLRDAINRVATQDPAWQKWHAVFT